MPRLVLTAITPDGERPEIFADLQAWGDAHPGQVTEAFVVPPNPSDSPAGDRVIVCVDGAAEAYVLEVIDPADDLGKFDRVEVEALRHA